MSYMNIKFYILDKLNYTYNFLDLRYISKFQIYISLYILHSLKLLDFKYIIFYYLNILKSICNFSGFTYNFKY